MPHDLVEKYLARHEQQAVLQGLLVAQLICQRRFLDAFDVDSGSTITASEVVSLIMGDISDTMERLKDGAK